MRIMLVRILAVLKGTSSQNVVCSPQPLFYHVEVSTKVSMVAASKHCVQEHFDSAAKIGLAVDTLRVPPSNPLRATCSPVRQTRRL